MSRKTLVAMVLVALLAGVAVGFSYQDPGAGEVETPDSPPVENGGNVSFQDGEAYVGLYDEVAGSVLAVRIDPDEEGQGGGLGSGFVYSEEGHVVTNHHVVQDEDEVTLRFLRGEWTRAEVVGTDPYTDLAVLEADELPEYADPLPVATELPDRGSPVAALGNPQGLEGSISSGIVAGLNRSMPAPNDFTIPDTVQVDTAVARGNSGGPITTLDGRVIGVTSRGQQSIGFGVSSRLVNRVIPDLIDDGEMEHAHIGISSLEVTPDIAEANGLDEPRGVMVFEVIEGRPAEGVLEGVRDVEERPPVGGDVILSFAGVEVDSHEELSRVLMTEVEPGDTVDIELVRDGEETTVELTLGTRPPP